MYSRIPRRLIVAGLAVLLAIPVLPETVAAAIPTITWPSPDPIAYGTPLSAAQLNATVDLGGSLVYTPPAGTVLDAGSGQTLTVDFTPTDPDDTTGTSSVTLTVTPVALTITAASPSMPYGGSVPNITASYDGLTNGDTAPATPPTCSTTATSSSPVGSYPTSCLGAWDPNYTISYVSGTLAVNPALPVIAWANPSAIVYGTALSSTQLDATASVPGTFAYSPASGTVLGAGSQTLSVTFTPTDPTHYTTATASVSIDVNQATPTISWATPAPITYGTPLSSTQLNASTGGVIGAFAYSPATGIVLGAGNQSLSVTFTPTDTTDYTTTSSSVGLTVTPASLSITASSGTITYGSTVPAITPSYSGFVNGDDATSLSTQPTCSTTATNTSAAGSYPTTCSGAVDGNYQIVYAAGVLFIVPPSALPILTVTPDPQTRPFGTANPTFTYVISGFINNQTLATALVSGVPACVTTATLYSPAGTYPITCSIGTLVSVAYSFTFVPGTLAIVHGASSVTLSTTTTVFETSTPVTWTAAVEPGVSGALPTGSLVFTIDGVARPAVPLDTNGRGSVSVTWTTPGVKSVQASYAGDASFAASGSASATPTVVANTARATGLGVSATTFYPFVDGWLDTVTVRGTRLEPLSVSISVKNASGSVVRTFTARTAAGPYAWAWNGRRSSGTPLPAGVYTIVQTLTDPNGIHPRTVKTSKVTLSQRTISWSTLTVSANPGPRCFQFTTGDGVGAYSCGAKGALKLAGSAGHWPGVGYQFQLPPGVGYRSIRVEVLGTYSGGRPSVGLHVWTLGSTWGQLYRPGWRRTAVSPTAKTWSGVTLASPSAYISGRSVRIYLDGGGRLAGAFTFSVTGIRLIVSVGTLQ